ncbi:helix-turn-helix domain-containing protein [Scandinavium sp. NPDC088450]|uniref:helix-turn-helix domain-containing protein n=1 Tax=Scandinavium sp. NPDC088450 TaxID=3364514 RepID=UPI00384AF32D
MNNSHFSLSHMNETFPFAKTLVEALLPFAEVKRYPKGTRINILNGETRVCQLILSGSIEIRRKSDNLLIVTLLPPNILGLSVREIYVITKESCQVATLPLDEAYRHFSELGLWETVAQHLLAVTNKLYSYSKQLSAPTVYEIICFKLVELMNEPELIRTNIAVERYIREKTHISRSSVMKILADLKTGGYIVLEEGRLLEIRHLPSKY